MELPTYPRTITIDHPKLVKLEKEKGQTIAEGREISKQIEEIDLEMGKIDIRLQSEEAKVDIKDLKAEGDAIVKEMEGIAKSYAERIKAVEVKIFEKMAANTDPQLRKDHEVLKAKKEELENERNKKALKAQRTKDRIIPLARRVMAPYLKSEYEDFMEIKLEGERIVGTIFSHLDDWDKRFKEKRKKILEK